MRLSPLSVLVSVTIGCNDQSFKVHEDPPTAAILEPGDGDGFVAGTPVAFRVQLDDNDDGVDALTVAWRSDTLGTLDGESSMEDTIQTFVTSDLVLGTHTVTVTATDPDGQTGEDTVEVVVRENSAPLVAIEHPSSSAEIAEGEDVVISVRASDPEESASSLRLTWVIDDTPQIDAPENPNESGEATYTVSDLDVGSHDIYVTVTDLAGLTANDLVSFTVLENQAPSISFTSPEEDEPFSVRDEISVWISATDPEEAVETLTLAWTVDGRPQTDATTNPTVDGTANLILPPFEEGTHTVGVSVTDSFGGTSSAEVNFYVYQPDVDGDGFDDVAYGGDDCNDSNDAIHPDADEICDGIDNDCDDLIDDEDGEISGGVVGYVDRDGDGFGGGSETVMRCDDTDLVDAGGDCDDDNALINPGVPETCNGIDDDCDGDTDEGFLVDLYVDSDEDGFGGGESFLACPETTGTVTTGGDCNDSNPDINPGATETCNDIDDDCDGETDEDLLVALYTDEDGDGFGTGDSFFACVDTEGTAAIGGDCNDFNEDIHPSATEVCNGEDDDCDEGIDEDLLVEMWVDVDDDRFGGGASELVCPDTPEMVTIGGDCDDTDEDVHPDAIEICNGIDDNCVDGVDEGFLVTLYPDEDEDGFGDTEAEPFLGCVGDEKTAENGDDCDDTDEDVHPDATEICNDIDDNCVDGVDEGLTTTLYTDEDGDGFGNKFKDPFPGCEGTEGTAETGGDCDDTDEDVHPMATEVCNGIDDNCVYGIDEGFLVTLYTDTDGDGFGGSEPFIGCEGTEGTVRVGGDCNDFDDEVHPMATEICNDIDDNCVDGIDEGLTTTLYTDSDEDGFGTGDSFLGCSSDSTTSTIGGDCNDDNSAVNPDAEEVCNGIDDDCDGVADEELTITVWVDEDGDGFGAGESYTGCEGVDDAVTVDGDCNDSDEYINPDAFEICDDGIDNNCDGSSGICAFGGSYIVDDEAGFSTHGRFGEDKIGTSLAGGDITGNGYTDLIIGSSGANMEADDVTGGVYIIGGMLAWGSSNIHEEALVQIAGNQPGDATGHAVLVASVNKDEYSDLIIGSPGVGSTSNRGEVSLFFGPVNEDIMGDDDFIRVNEADVVISGIAEPGRLGHSLASGDLNGDGFPDLAFGAPHEKTSKNESGAVYFFSGDRDWDTIVELSPDDHDAKIYSDQSEMQLGLSIAFIGDANMDGRDDLLMGAPGAPIGGVDKGAAFLMLGHLTKFGTGSELRHTTSDAWYGGERNNDEAGFTVAGLGDIDDDGRTEFAIGARANDENGSDAGAMYIMLEPSLYGGVYDVLDESGIQFYGAEAGDQLGKTAPGTMDFNNDAVTDLIVGTPEIDCPAASCGRAYVFYGPIVDIESTNLGEDEGTEDASFRGLGVRDFAASALLTGHDLNGDDIDDLGIAAKEAPGLDGSGDAGAVHVVFGKGM